MSPMNADLKQTPRATAVESALALRRALRAAFPSTKFTVRLDRGTAYGCASVRWTDGPTSKSVDAVVSQFEGEGFDGMTDSSFRIRSVMPDGRVTGLRLISTSRFVSVTLARKAAAQVAKFYGLPLPVIEELDGGDWRVPGDSKWVRDDVREYWGTLIHQAAGDRSRFALAVPASEAPRAWPKFGQDWR